MPTEWFEPLMFAMGCLCGGGLLISVAIFASGSTIALPRIITQALVGVAAIGAGVFSVAALIFGQSVAIWGSAAAFFVLYCLIIVGPSPLFCQLAMNVVSLAHTRHGRLVLILATLFVSPFIALGLYYQQIDIPDTLTPSNLAIMVGDEGQPERSTVSPLSTDRGRTVAILKVNSFQGPTPELLAAQKAILANNDLNADVVQVPTGWQNCNCHGFTFTAGQYWVGGLEVDNILQDNGYLPVSQVKSGDLAVYRNERGEVIHTGVVCGLASDGLILVESKWGKLGRFIHRHDRHFYGGTTCCFYRSPRPGHLLNGVDTEAAALVSPPIVAISGKQPVE